MTNVLALPPGTDLIGEFRIERMLGAGGFGMTYLAEETALARLVTIKEYFPTEFAARGENFAASPRDEEAVADFQWGLDRFIDEAQTLARFDHPHIVRVYRYFKANGTAYMVLAFEEGQSLKAWLRGLGRQPRQAEIDAFTAPLLEALETIHAADFLHRDIAPDNIIIRRDGSPVLIDFGSARGEIAAKTRTVSALVKPGYSPYEQYAESGARQGPWTDIYALGATLYHAVCAKRPPDAPSRVVRDEIVPVRDAVLGTYRSRFLDAIDRALKIDPAARPQSILAWRGDLLAPDPAKPGWFKRATGLSPQPSAGSDAGAARTRVLTQQPGALPPPPDAPGAPGQMLDYIEGLQPKEDQKSREGQQPGPTPIDPQAPSSSAAAKSKSRPSARLAVGSGRPTPASAPAGDKLPVPAKSKAPRPRAMPGERRARWRSFATKFMIGAGIAGAAIFLNDPPSSTSPPIDPSNPVTPIKMASSKPAPPPVSTERALPSIERTAAADVRVQPSPEPQHRLTMLPGHRGGATTVGFTEDGRTVVTSGADGMLRVWNAATGAALRAIPLDAGAPTAAAVEGRRALTGHSDGRLMLWDIDTGGRLATFKRADSPITAVAISPDGQRLLATGRDATLASWDPSTPQTPTGLVEAHDGPVLAVAYAARGHLVATGGADNTVRLWRAGTLELVRTYRGHKESITALAFSPDGRHLAAAAEDGRIRVWSTSSASLYRLTTAHKGSVRGLAFSPAGDIIASAGEDGSVQLWLVRQSRSVRSLADHGSPARSLAFTPDGSRAAVASADGSIRFWDAAPVGRMR